MILQGIAKGIPYVKPSGFTKWNIEEAVKVRVFMQGYVETFDQSAQGHEGVLDQGVQGHMGVDHQGVHLQGHKEVLTHGKQGHQD